MTSLVDLNAARLLRERGFRPRHRLGQNFLQDRAALEQIVAAAELQAHDTVLEIGAGFGSLTAHLAHAARSVVAVEIDPRLSAIAADYLGAFHNVRFVCGDILALSPSDLGLPPDYVAAANIPYYVTSPILRHLLESSPSPRRIVLTVQQEVADRICSAPPEMSLLSLSVQVYGRPVIVARVPAEAFYPKPKVDSAVVRIEAYAAPLIATGLIPVVFRLAKAGFMQKRKMLRNALSSGLHLSPSESADLLSAADIDPGRRAQTMSVEEWGRLAELAGSRIA